MALVLIPLGALCAFVALYGMQQGFNASLGELLRNLAKLLSNINKKSWFLVSNVAGFLAKEVTRLDLAVRHTIGAALLRSDQPVTRWLRSRTQLVNEMAALSSLSAVVMLQQFRAITHSAIPAAIGRAHTDVLGRLKGIDQETDAVKAKQRADAKRLALGIDTIKTGALPKIRADAKATRTRVGRLERTQKAQAKSLSRVTARFKALAFAGAVALALSRIFGSWIRCPAIPRIGRKIGCRGFSFLDDLLALSFVPFLLTDACSMVRVIGGIADRVIPYLDELVLSVEGFVCGGTQALPSGIVAADLKHVSRLPTGL